MYPIRVRGSALIIENEAVLLVEFHDENGLHYNLPGGGVEQGESLLQTVKREAREEASVDIEVGEVAFLYEYAPHLNYDKYGSVHSLTTIFDCSLREEENPKVPEERDQNQTGVKWVLLDELHTIVLYPNLREEISAYYKKKHSIPLLEEQFLKSY
ncbi:NUDIX domain-containing protein [Priestia endophytica]|uniref:NUDIX hydrolase n=1 Tax=Priestia endophytica TaxID=135735 RepID=A0AAX1QB30_9BACI|nr:NUDIX domain-containing protein [Priestia endophytica]RAS78604.1 NUDIX hydrolase [Priestia endophytica]RAS85535.1 NUDIX hydrolase [Priestia endophytica]